MFPGLLEQGDDLLALHTRETFQELLNRIARFQMIEPVLSFSGSNSCRPAIRAQLKSDKEQKARASAPSF